MEWTGKTFRIKAIHIYELEQEDNSTAVRSAESWDGLLVRPLNDEVVAESNGLGPSALEDRSRATGENRRPVEPG
jgi:hypothetical protein